MYTQNVFVGKYPASTLPSRKPRSWLHSKPRTRSNRAIAIAVDVDQTSLSDNFCNSSSPDIRYLGNIEVAYVEGKGRGLVATSSLPKGQTIMVCQPFLSFGDNDLNGMIAWLACRICPRDSMEALDILSDGKESGTNSLPDLTRLAMVQGDGDVTDLDAKGQSGYFLEFVRDRYPALEGVTRDLLVAADRKQQSFRDRWLSLAMELTNHPSIESVFHEFEAQILPALLPLLKGKCTRNCFCGTPDPVLSLVANQELAGPGENAIFLNASFINHSCIPNARWYVHGKALRVVASQDIDEGEEVTVDYGYGGFLPVEVRRSLLRDYGFRCECPRCKHDTAQPKYVQKLVFQSYSLTEQYWPTVKKGGVSGISALQAAEAMAREEKVAYLQQVDQIWSDLAKVKGMPEEKVHLTWASMASSRLLAAAVLMSLGEELTAGLLLPALAGIEVVAPASLDHLVMYILMFGNVSPSGLEMDEEQWLAYTHSVIGDLLRTRYGPVSDDILGLLLRAASQYVAGQES